MDVGSLRDRLSRLVHSLRDYFCGLTDSRSVQVLVLKPLLRLLLAAD